MKFPFTFVRRAPLTLMEQKREAWTGPIAYRYTAPVEQRKQWKPVLKMKRKLA